jgi:hypothetical protein
MEEKSNAAHSQKEAHMQHKIQKAARQSGVNKPRRSNFKFLRRRKNGGVAAQPLQSAQAQNNAHQHHRQLLGHKLISSVSGLISKSFGVFILWTLLCAAVFTAGAYFVFAFAIADRGFPLWYNILLGCVLFGIYGLFGLFYGFMMAALYTVKSFSYSVGGLVKEAISRVKNSIESRIDNISETISRNQVVEVVRQTFAELSRNIRQYAARSAAGFMALGVLTGAVFIARGFLIRSAENIKNKADFYTLLSAKAALVLAVILNLSFFAKLALWFGFLIGLIAALAQALMIFLVK